MDNEEIRKLLQELKKNSDESTAVRSEVVKIHFDTPQEAEKRRKAKERARAQEEKRRLREEEEARAAEEARRLEAERMAREVVEEAKKEAKSGFSSDLEKDLSDERQNIREEETGENADDLDLNWEYERPVLSTDESGRKSSGEDEADGPDAEEDPDYMSDTEDFEGEEPPREGGALKSAFRKMSGGFSALTERLRERDPGEEIPENEEEEDAFDADADVTDAADAGRAQAADVTGAAGAGLSAAAYVTNAAGAGLSKAPDVTNAAGAGLAQDEDADADAAGNPEAEEAFIDPDEEWKRRMEEPPARKKKRGSFRSKPSGSRKPLFGKKKETSGEEKASRRKLFTRSKADLTDDAKAKWPEAEDTDLADDADAEWPEAESADLTNDAEAEWPEAESADPTNDAEAEWPEAEKADLTDDAKAGLTQKADEETDFAAADVAAEEKTARTGWRRFLKRGRGTAPAKSAPADTEPADREPSDRESADSEPADAKEAPLQAEEPFAYEAAAGKHIEVIDLDENTNSREAEVIPLDPSTTGPLPKLKEGRILSAQGTEEDPAKEERRKKRLHRKKRSSGKKTGTDVSGTDAGSAPSIPVEEDAPNETLLRIRAFVGDHRKQLVAGIAAAVVLIAVIAGCMVLVSNHRNRRKASIRADEGLTVQVLSQPDAFCSEGDVTLRVKAPETIQSVTVNGTNVDITQGRSVDFPYHADTGSLELMAVSTDKVRSADIVLAYVDSEPPKVTVSMKDGKMALNAEDSESGVQAVYVGKTDGLSDIPMYETYTEPIPADEAQVISYYAVDEAGNSSAPVTTAMAVAQELVWPQNRYTVFPGSSLTLEVGTVPENAYVNNLTFAVENEKVAKISGNVLTGVSEGDTKITASADGLAPVQASVSVKSDRSVTISCVGDCTLGTDINLSSNTSFNAYQAMYGDGYFFEKVRPILSQDDATFANFEGTLTTLDESHRKDKPFAFKADPAYAEILNEGSIEVVTLANNHTYDYGDESTEDTKKSLDAAGVNWCSGDDVVYMDLNGVKTAFIGIYALENGLESMDQVKRTVSTAKSEGAEVVVIHFHWGVELITSLDEFETQLAHAAIDAGADLVLGTHAHMLLPVEKYNGRYIVYGLSNFCFGGNPYPHSYESMIWQQTFSFGPDGLEDEDDIRIIPCRISSETGINNYQPVPVSGDEAASIIQTLNSLSSPYGLTFDQYMVDGTQITG